MNYKWVVVNMIYKYLYVNSIFVKKCVCLDITRNIFNCNSERISKNIDYMVDQGIPPPLYEYFDCMSL